MDFITHSRAVAKREWSAYFQSPVAYIFIIIFLVLGINRKSLTAFGGAIAGLTMTTVFTLYFGEHMQLNGATAAFAESFLYSGS